MGNLLGPAHCVIKTVPPDTRVNLSFIEAEFWGAGIDPKQPKTGSNSTFLLRKKKRTKKKVSFRSLAANTF